MIIKEFTKPGLEVNEDAIYASQDFGFVLDGATGLLKENITPFKSDAQWFTQEIKTYFIKNLGKTVLTLKQIVANAILEINKKYNSFDGANQIKSRPSSGVAIYRLNGENIEYFILGDCSFIIRDNKNKIINLKIEDLPKLDRANIQKMVKTAKENSISVIDARKLINDDLFKTRLSQNTDDGYYIFSDDIKAVDHAFCGKLPIKNIKQIVGLSDGFSAIYDSFFIYTKKQLLDNLKKGVYIEEIYNILWNEQEKDKECNKFPRFKVRDDASLIYLDFVEY